MLSVDKTCLCRKDLALQTSASEEEDGVLRLIAVKNRLALSLGERELFVIKSALSVTY